MSVAYVNAELRRLVTSRAGNRCEYCLIHEKDTFFGCEIDHIISEKHGGPTNADNLALACMICNRNKGSDIGSVLQPDSLLVRFFNPRTDAWVEHFAIDKADGVTIVPLTEIGIVTARILAFNSYERLLERQTLRDAGDDPLQF